MKSIILLSGGLDSAVSLALEKNNIELALTFDYGQRAAKREIEASKGLAEYYRVAHKIIKLDWLKDITRTALVDNNQELELLKEDELDDMDKALISASKVWVPNRNGLMLNIAGSFADSFGYEKIIFGANKEEGTTFPDNTQEFIDRTTKSLEYSTLTKPKVSAPLINLTKNKIVERAKGINFPFSLIRSCYEDFEKHCGKCESCKRLKRALAKNGIKADFM